MGTLRLAWCWAELSGASRKPWFLVLWRGNWLRAAVPSQWLLPSLHLTTESCWAIGGSGPHPHRPPRCCLPVGRQFFRKPVRWAHQRPPWNTWVTSGWGTKPNALQGRGGVTRKSAGAVLKGRRRQWLQRKKVTYINPGMLKDLQGWKSLVHVNQQHHVDEFLWRGILDSIYPTLEGGAGGLQIQNCNLSLEKLTI